MDTMWTTGKVFQAGMIDHVREPKERLYSGIIFGIMADALRSVGLLRSEIVPEYSISFIIGTRKKKSVDMAHF